MKILITNDLFDIVKRLKQIDNDYFVLFNLKNQKFELHHTLQGKNTYCLTFPYSQLDVRAINYALKTSVKNSEKLFFEIEENNSKIERQNENRVKDEYEYKIKDILSYANNSSKNLDFNNIHKNKWV